MAFLTDTFTEASDTAIGSHTSDSGHTWTQHPNFANGMTVLASEGRLRGDSSGSQSLAYSSATPASDEYDVEGTVRRAGSPTNGQPGLIARCSTSAHTYLRLMQDIALGTLSLQEVSGGSVSESSTYATTWASDTNYDLKLEVRNGAAATKGYLAGVQRVSVTANVVTGAGVVGAVCRLNGRVDNLTVTDYSTGVAVPVFYMHRTQHGQA